MQNIQWASVPRYAGLRHTSGMSDRPKCRWRVGMPVVDYCDQSEVVPPWWHPFGLNLHTVPSLAVLVVCSLGSTMSGCCVPDQLFHCCDHIAQSYRTWWVILAGSRLLATLVCKLIAGSTTVSWHPLNENICWWLLDEIDNVDSWVGAAGNYTQQGLSGCLNRWVLCPVNLPLSIWQPWTASFSSSNDEVKAAPLLSSEWMMTGEAGSRVVATIAAPPFRVPSVAEPSV